MAAHFVTASALFVLIGMFILIWSSTGHSGDWWNEDSKLAVAFTIVAAIIAAVFFSSRLHCILGEGQTTRKSRMTHWKADAFKLLPL